MHIFCKLLFNMKKRISPMTPVSVLTSQYLRHKGTPQSIPFGIGHTYTCGSELKPDNNKSSKRPIHPDKVRLGFIPEEWFEFFYPKTGKTGPYIFGFGLINYLLSKEIYVCEHEFYTGLAMTILCIVAVKKLGPKIANYTDKEIDKFEQNWKKQQEEELKALQQLIDHEEREQWRAEGSLMLMQVKKENIALQVEAAYREALMKVYNDVKQRLDYQLECSYVEKRMNHKHMVNWLVKNITEQLPENPDLKELKKIEKDVSAMAINFR